MRHTIQALDLKKFVISWEEKLLTLEDSITRAKYNSWQPTEQCLNPKCQDMVQTMNVLTSEKEETILRLERVEPSQRSRFRENSTELTTEARTPGEYQPSIEPSCRKIKLVKVEKRAQRSVSA